MDDEYGFKKELQGCGLEKVIECFNDQVGNLGWVRARGYYLSALKDRLLSTGLDCSDFISEDSMTLKYPIRLVGRKLVQIMPTI